MSSSHSHRHYGPFAAMLLAAFALLCMGAFAAAQEQPAPKWELYGGYSFFHPGADIHGVLPLGLLPVSSRLEPNPRGLGASLTYRWKPKMDLQFTYDLAYTSISFGGQPPATSQRGHTGTAVRSGSDVSNTLTGGITYAF